MSYSESPIEESRSIRSGAPSPTEELAAELERLFGSHYGYPEVRRNLGNQKNHESDIFTAFSAAQSTPQGPVIDSPQDHLKKTRPPLYLRRNRPALTPIQVLKYDPTPMSLNVLGLVNSGTGGCSCREGNMSADNSVGHASDNSSVYSSSSTESPTPIIQLERLSRTHIMARHRDYGVARVPACMTQSMETTYPVYSDVYSLSLLNATLEAQLDQVSSQPILASVSSTLPSTAELLSPEPLMSLANTGYLDHGISGHTQLKPLYTQEG